MIVVQFLVFLSTELRSLWWFKR